VNVDFDVINCLNVFNLKKVFPDGTNGTETLQLAQFANNSSHRIIT